jgi:plastocyanin
MNRSTKALLAGLALTGALGLTACGGGDGKDDASTPAPKTADCGATPGATVTVEIGDFVFDPTPVKVHACDQVVWHNGHDQAHTSSASGGQSWNTGNIQPGETSDPVPFPAAGSFPYMCALHPFMKASVEVS